MREQQYVPSLVRLAVLLVIMALSILVISPIASKPETYKLTIAKLEEKQETVMKVTASATVTSIGIAAIPDDATTPVANKIMDLVGYLVLVLCAIVLEKYLLTIIGYVAFHWLIPLACVLFGINTFTKNRTITNAAVKLLILSGSLLLVVPVSMQVSDMIEQTSALVMEINDESLDSVELPAETEADVPETEMAQTEETEEAESGGNWFSDILNTVSDKINDTKDAAAQLYEDTKDKVAEYAGMTMAKAQEEMNKLIEVVVVLIVTNCLLPVFVFVFLMGVIKLILGIQFDIPEHGRGHKFSHRRDAVKE